MNVPNFDALQQCEQVIVQNTTMPYMTSLHSCLNRVVGAGYADVFKPTTSGLQSGKTHRVYAPKEITVVNTFRFEGNSNPRDNVTMYVIETADGLKGTLVNKCGEIEDHMAAKLGTAGKAVSQKK